MAKYKHPFCNNLTIDKDNCTKLEQFTWHNFVHISQKYLKDPFSLCEGMVATKI